MRTRCALLVLPALAMAACAAARGPETRPALENEGALFVYLEPLPQDAAGLSFAVRSVSAIRDDGAGMPLVVQLRDVGMRSAGRERLLAWGALSPGAYAAVALELASASLRGARDTAELQAPEAPVRVEIPFSVARRRAAVLTLRLHFRDSVSAEGRFEPALSAAMPDKLAEGLLGLATASGANTVTIFDKTTGAVSAVVPTGRQPRGLAVDPASRRAYVTIEDDDAIEVIDLLQPAVIDRLRLTAGDRPADAVLTGDGSRLLVVDSGSDTVSFVDPRSLFEIRRVPVGNGPSSVALDPQGRRAYVFNTLADSITVLDVVSGAVVANLATDAGPLRGAFNRAGDRLFVIQESSSNLLVLDPSSLSVVQRVYVGLGATALKVDTRTDRIFVGRRGTAAVDIYDPFSLLPVDSIPAGGDVSYLTLDGERNDLGLVLRDGGEVALVRNVGHAEFARVDVGDAPARVAFMGER